MYNEMEELKKRIRVKKLRIQSKLLPQIDMNDASYLLGQHDALEELEKDILDIQLYEGPKDNE